MAQRSEPTPLSTVFVTVNVAAGAFSPIKTPAAAGRAAGNTATLITSNSQNKGRQTECFIITSPRITGSRCPLIVIQKRGRVGRRDTRHVRAPRFILTSKRKEFVKGRATEGAAAIITLVCESLTCYPNLADRHKLARQSDGERIIYDR